MKVSQKLLAVLLSLAMLFSLAGCGLDSIVSDSPTSISDRSTDSESSIIDDRSEIAGLTETVDECSESNRQEETTSPSSKPSSVGSGTATHVKVDHNKLHPVWTNEKNQNHESRPSKE